jgi:hypothetical protein
MMQRCPLCGDLIDGIRLDHNYASDARVDIWCGKRQERIEMPLEKYLEATTWKTVSAQRAALALVR